MNTPGASDYGSFNMDSVEQAENRAVLVINGLAAVLSMRGDLLHDKSSTAAARAAAMAASSSSSAGGSSSPPAGATVVPHEQQLLLSLLLTVAEYMLLLPAPSQGVLPSAMQLLARIVKQSSAQRFCAVGSSGAAAATAADDLALADALVVPVLLQVGPAVLRYVRDANAAGAGAAAAVGQAMLGRHAAGCSSDAEDVSTASGCLAMIALEVLEAGA
jgi:hypothetical protein